MLVPAAPDNLECVFQQRVQAAGLKPQSPCVLNRISEGVFLFSRKQLSHLQVSSENSSSLDIMGEGALMNSTSWRLMTVALVSGHLMTI